jgi:hypothetical protein
MGKKTNLLAACLIFAAGFYISGCGGDADVRIVDFSKTVAVRLSIIGSF